MLTMTAVKIDDRLTVASQPSQEALAALAADRLRHHHQQPTRRRGAGPAQQRAEKAILEQAGLPIASSP
jgi:protein tyrosine phosphatase (PTP) superfamily phosphohydrolase (DUF442 family)